MRRMLLLLTLFTFASSSAGQSSELPPRPPVPKPDPAAESWREVIDSGRHLLEAARYDAAREAFTRSFDAAPDRATKARSLFYLAAVEEEEGAEGFEQRAAGLYRKALSADRTLAGAANNLAQLLARSGDRAAALKYQTMAVAAKDPRQPFYRRNLAALLAAEGRPAEALKEYEAVLEAEPNDLEAERALLDLSDAGRREAYLWKLVSAGASDRAQDHALRLVPGAPTEQAKRELMKIVAVTLARQEIRPRTYDSLPAARRLQALASDAVVGEGVKELRSLITGADSDYPWWSYGDCGESFGTLARELARRHVEAERLPAAEKALNAAVKTTRGEDPDVILALAELYYRQGRISEIDEILSRYEGGLFSEKSIRYQRGDWASIYRFHVALGTMYAAVGKTGSEGDPRSAIFQLEHARTAAERNNQKPGAATIHVDPVLVERLADSYEKAARPDAAATVRLDAATGYVKEGRTVAAQQTLEPLAQVPQKVPARDARRFEELRKAVAPAVVPPGSTDYVKPQATPPPGSTDYVKPQATPPPGSTDSVKPPS